jgi:hypothetical protein
MDGTGVLVGATVTGGTVETGVSVMVAVGTGLRRNAVCVALGSGVAVSASAIVARVGRGSFSVVAAEQALSSRLISSSAAAVPPIRHSP